MELLARLFSFIFGVGLIVLATFYFISPHRVIEILKKVVPGIAVLFILMYVMTELVRRHPVAFVMGLLILSLGAYAVRGTRQPHQQNQRRSGSPARTPILPHTGDPNEQG